MCTNKSWITNKRGRRILVKCGKCPACLQEKAIARTNRIRANVPEDGSIMTLFVTLTYQNKFVPYFDFDEFKTSPLIESSHFNPIFPNGKVQYKRLHIYRNASHRYVRGTSDYDNVSKVFYKKVLLSTVNIPATLCYNYRDAFCSDDLLDYFGTSFVDCPKKIRYHGKELKSNKVSVCYYKDVQDFIKRLRINLQRKYNYEDNFSFYACSEYGETYARAHFHLLLFVKRRHSFAQSEDFKMWQNAIVEAWPFANKRVSRNSVEIARNPASYVASYVNCLASLPDLLREVKELRPKHSYSQGFGQALRCLQFEEIFKAYERRDLHVDLPRIKNHCLVVERVLLPKYVISRYFPKFKGYCNLTSDEIVGICYRPSEIRKYAQRCQYTETDCHRISVMIENKKKLCQSYGLDTFQFAQLYSNIWTIYGSNALRDFYDDCQTIKDYFTAYDNINEFLELKVSSLSLDEVGELLPSNFHFYNNPNLFPKNLAKNKILEDSFARYRKDRKVRNLCITKSTNFEI